VKLTRVWLMGMAVMLGWVSLTASQDRPRPSRLPQGVKVLQDLQYVEDGHKRNHLDLYLPEKAVDQLPLVVWIHGGAWQAGSKENCPAVA
jgi:acetyl esterase/lipase